MKELSYALSLNSNTLTPVLKRMEKRGWIVREKPRDDKRQLIIHLSNKGIESQDAVVNAVQSCGYFSQKLVLNLIKKLFLPFLHLIKL